jgi:TolB protein
MNDNGSGQHRVTRDRADLEPAWSPDGNRIAFLSYRRGVNIEIDVMNVNGSNERRLAGNATDGSGPPAWSPDSRHLAFTRTRRGDTEIYVLNANGSRKRRLTEMGGG